jgi:hypothetical protein
MVTHTLQRIEFSNIKLIVDEIEKKFPVDPVYRDWKSRKEINIRCPKCPDKRYHLGLSFAKNSFNCFRCSYSGRLTEFLREHRINFNSERQIISPEVTTEALKIKFPRNFFNYDFYYVDIARNYLVKRGFDVKFLKNNFEIWPITDKNHFYFGYLIVRLNDYAFYARDFLERKDKEPHIIRKSDKKMKLFYAFERNNSSTILVVESMFNLMKASQFGFDTVCIFGKGKWGSLIEYLKNKNNRSICLCFDNDVRIDNIEQFVTRINKNCENTKISYIDPNVMPVNDIAMIQEKDVLMRLVKNKKDVSEIFLDTFNLGE